MRTSRFFGVASATKKYPHQHYGDHQPDYPAQAAALTDAAVIVQPFAVRQTSAWDTHGASGFAVLEEYFPNQV